MPRANDAADLAARADQSASRLQAIPQDSEMDALPACRADLPASLPSAGPVDAEAVADLQLRA